MKTLPSILTIAIAAGVIGGISNGAVAAPVTYDFTGGVSGNQALGGTHIYTAAGGPNITGLSGSYTHSGSGVPVTGDPFAAGGQLVGNNRGSDDRGVGVCFGNRCNNGHIDDAPEIDASGREAVRLDITNLLAANFGSFIINADSATDGEKLGIFAGNAAGTALGTKLGDITSSSGNYSINPLGNYLFFVAYNTTTSEADVLLHSLTVTPDPPDPVPEPSSIALLGTAIFGIGLMRQRRQLVRVRVD